jgi:hypothetical protein
MCRTTHHVTPCAVRFCALTGDTEFLSKAAVVKGSPENNFRVKPTIHPQTVQRLME